MIFLKAVRQVIDPGNPNIPRPEFDVEIFKENGELVQGRVVCTSTNFERDTMNLKFLSSGQTRKFHASLLVKFNGKEVAL
jgi:hypothetical protein